VLDLEADDPLERARELGGAGIRGKPHLERLERGAVLLRGRKRPCRMICHGFTLPLAFYAA
jgi:hypothetical protein